MVQLYSALIYQGWPVIGRIKRELNDLLRRDGFTTVVAAVGADHPRLAAVAQNELTGNSKAWWRLW